MNPYSISINFMKGNSFLNTGKITEYFYPHNLKIIETLQC